MNRRTFVQMLAAVPLTGRTGLPAPAHRIVSSYRPAATPGMPGPFKGHVVSVTSNTCVDEASNAANAAAVQAMLGRGMCALTGAATPDEAWRRFFEPSDVVGIKVNCGGHPYVVSAPEIVADVVRQLMAVGVRPDQIYIYERFQNQLDAVNYTPHLPPDVRIVAAEGSNQHSDNSGYDPGTYLEADLFGEEDTRSCMMRLVSQRLTKIINIPNMKDHGATGVTGCLKNIAYGSFSNVARTHYHGVSHTRTVVGLLASVEPVRSRTVLQIMDGVRGVWHGGPFAHTNRYVFYPKRILLSTDPVAIDRLLLDIIDDKRRSEGALSIWDRSRSSLKTDDVMARDADPNVNIIIREPGHVEFASSLGLGVHDRAKIRVDEIRL